MEIYDQNVLTHLKISPEIHSLADAHALHNSMLNFRQYLALEAGEGEFYPHYRTEQVFGWDIMPGLFRGANKFDSLHGKELERKAIAEYEFAIVQKVGEHALRDLFKNNTNGTKWDLLFQAQHCGLRTSLLDWTMYIASSLFFGIEESSNPKIEAADAQIWVFMVHENRLLNSDKGDNSYLNHDPFTLTKGFMTNVPIYLDDLEERICEQRISRQGGRFYISPAASCNIPMNRQPDVSADLFRFRIPTQYKSVIRKELDAVGINKATIYVKESLAHESIANEINEKIYGF